MSIPIRTPAEIDAIARAARVVRRALDAAVDALRPGVTTIFVAHAASRALRDAGAESLFDRESDDAGRTFPHAVCICVNEQAVHGVPGDRTLESHDLVTIDLGGRLDGWCADLARSAVVGGASDGLLDAARVLTDLACGLCQPGACWGDVARAVAANADKLGVYLLDGFAGHGIGRELHEQPVARLGPLHERAATAGGGSSQPTGCRSNHDLILRPGMVLTVEPIVCNRPVGTVLDADGWTVRTRDGSRACYAERMVAITRAGPRILGGKA